MVRGTKEERDNSRREWKEEGARGNKRREERKVGKEEE